MKDMTTRKLALIILGLIALGVLVAVSFGAKIDSPGSIILAIGASIGGAFSMGDKNSGRTGGDRGPNGNPLEAPRDLQVKE